MSSLCPGCAFHSLLRALGDTQEHWPLPLGGPSSPAKLTVRQSRDTAFKKSYQVYFHQRLFPMIFYSWIPAQAVSLLEILCANTNAMEGTRTISRGTDQISSFQGIPQTYDVGIPRRSLAHGAILVPSKQFGGRSPAPQQAAGG